MSKSTQNNVAKSQKSESEQEANFWEEIEAARSDRNVMTELLGRFERLIRAKVRRFQGRGVDEDDLRQIACLAFQNAIKKVSLERLNTFKSYAATAIDNEILSELQKVSSSNRKQWDLIADYSKTENAIFEETGALPHSSDVYEKLDWTARDISKHQSLCSLRDKSLSSIMNPLGEESKAFDTAESNLPNSQLQFSHDYHMQLAEFNKLVESLPPNEKELINSRYLMKISQKTYAKQADMTEYKVRKMELQILAKLKNAIGCKPYGDEGMKG